MHFIVYILYLNYYGNVHQVGCPPNTAQNPTGFLVQPPAHNKQAESGQADASPPREHIQTQTFKHKTTHPDQTFRIDNCQKNYTHII